MRRFVGALALAVPFLVASLPAEAQDVLTQGHYRWRNDDGGEGDVDTVQVSDTADTTTVSGTYELVSGMTITPGAGDYLVWFSGSLESTAGGSTQNVSLFVDGGQITHTEREILTEGSIPDTPFTAVTHAFLPGVTAGQAINVRWRTSGGTATMHQRTLVLTKVNAADVTQVSATANDTTTSAAYTAVTGMSITPGAGDYLVWFSGSVNGDTNTTEQQVSLFVNGVQVAHTERRADQEDSLTNTYFPVGLHVRLTSVGAAEAIDVRWQTTGGTATMAERTLTVYQINPADSSQASATLDDTTVSATWTPVDSMALTPGVGDYRIWFSSSVEGTTANSVQDVALYVNGIQVAHTVRSFLLESSLTDTFQSFPVALHAYVTGVGAADVIDVRWQTSGGTATMHERTLVVDRLQSVSGATFAAAEDTKLTALTKNTLKRVRFEVSNEGAGGSGPVAYELQVAETATCSSGTYTTVPTAATGHWQVIDSSFITDGEASSNVTDGLTDEATTFVAGEAKDTGNTTGSITLASDAFTEIEFAVQALAAATNGGDYCFRLYDATNNQVLDAYSVYAEVSLAVDVLTQGHYRWRNDDGGEVAATWAAAEDTALSPLEKNTIRRVRLGVSNEGTASSGGVAYELQVAETATCSAGAYAAVPIAATGHWQVINSSFITDGEVTSNVAGGLTDDATTFVAGEAKDTGNPTSGFTLAPDEFTEIEFAVQATNNATAGGDYCFRLYDATNNEVLDTYTVYAQVTLATDVLTQGHYRWRNDDGGEGSVDNFQVSETVDTMTTGGSYELVSGMTITPGAGDYLVWFSGSLESTTGGSTQHVSLFVDTGQITHTEREVLTEGSIPDTPFTAVTHAFLPGVTAGQAINVRWRTTGGTATMHQRTLAVTRVNPADVTQVSATANDTTTSAAYTAVTGMSITPGAGDYLVWFSGSVNGNTNTTEQQVSLFVNGVQVAHTERRADQEDSLTNTYFPVALHARLTGVGAAEAIDVRWQTTGGTATMAERTLTVYQINAADSAQASATLDDTTVSATWTPVDSMALTPGAGDYLVWFSSSLEGTTANSVQDVALYVNGIQVAYTLRNFLVESSLIDTFQSFPVALHAYVTGVGAADVIDVRWQTSGGTATMHERTLVVQRVTNPSGATWAAAEDTKLTGLAKSTIKRVRLEVSNGGTGSSGAVTYELQVAETATCSAGTYTTVPTAATGHWQVIDSGFITDAEPTFNINPGLTDGATTFVSGESKDTGNTTGSITLASDAFTEIEFSVQALAAATDGGDYCFRLYDATNSQVLDTYSVYSEVQLGAPPTDVTVSASGTQTASMFIPSTDQYVGGKFVIIDNTGSRNITGITITESGTVDALNNLDNIKLFYELDTTAPYDGASESYAGGELQFGVTDTDGFSAANGTSSFTDTVAIDTTSTLVVYVVFDVGAGATPGETVEISINDPSTEVTASAGTVGPATPVAIPGTTTLTAAVTVSASGTQTASMAIPSTNQYVGGKFVIVDNTGSRNITGITITESGTVDALNNLDNIKLFYELDSTAPYDGASESYAGTESQFGVTDTTGFSAANGTSSFTDTVAINTTSTLVMYVVLDVGAGASGGETVEISINDPSTEVTASAGTVGPATPVAISGTTTLSAGSGGVIFYSVGTDNTALYSDTASASAGTLTLNSPAVDKIGVGDEIREGTNRYYITGRNSATEFTIQNSAANGGTPGDTNISFASTAITIFRAFNSLTSAEAGSTDTNHLNTADLVAGNFQVNWTCYNDAALDDMVLINGYTTGASNYIHIYTPTATSEVGTSQRHTGTAGTGFRLVPNTSTPPSQVNIIDILDDDVRLTGIEIDGSSITNAQNLAGISVDVSVSASGDIQLNKIILHDLQSQDGTGGDADVNALDIANGNLKLSNSIIYDIAQTTANANARTRGVDITGGSNHYLHNNTLFNIKNSLNTHSAYGINVGAGTVTVRNTVVLDVVSALGSEGCFNGTITQLNNVSSDTTAVGPQNQTAYATYFQNITNGSENLHLRNDSTTLWGSFGADLDADPNLPVTDDIDGDARDASTPDIGADEFTGAVGAGVVFYSVGTDNTALYSGNASASSGTLTLSSPAADRIGVGDEIREGANRYYINGRNSATEFTVQNSAANGGTPGDTNINFASTAITIFRAFNDLDTATTGSADANHLNTADLVAGDFQLNWACYNDGPDPSWRPAIEEPWVTGASNYIRLFTPTDPSQVGVSQRHTGTAGTGYRIRPVGSAIGISHFNFVFISTDNGYVRLEGIEIDGSGLTNAENIRGIYINDPAPGTGEDVRISHSLIHDLVNTTIDDSDQSKILALYVDQTNNTKISNNVVYHLLNVSTNAASETTGLDSVVGGTTHYVFNNTFYDIQSTATTQQARGIWDSVGSTLDVQNNYVGLVDSVGGLEACFVGPFANENNNVSSDATAAGTDSQTNQSAYASYFVDTTGGSENLHLINDSNTLWGSFGADLDTDPNLPVTDDIDADARDASTPDIGADEFSNPVIVTFYSVGTDNTALYSDTGSASSGTLTLNSAAVDKIGVGDEIREGANRYYITGRISATQFTIQNSAANGGTPGDTNITFGLTAITIFRAFNTLTAAEAGSLDGSHLGTANLVVSNFQLNWTCYNDTALDDTVIVNSYTTGPNNYIYIYTPTDATEVGVSQRHDGTAGTGFRMVPVINSPVGITRVLRVADDHVRITGIEIDGSSITDGQEIEGVSTANTLTAASDVRFTKLIVHDIHSENGSGSDADPIGIAIGGGNVKLSNSIIYDIVQTTAHVDADARGIRTSGGANNVYFHSNTIFNIKNTGATRFAWGIHSGGGTVTAKNTVVLDVEATSGTEGCFNGAMTQSNNVSSDATAVGPQNQTAYASYFQNITDGSEDLHLLNDSNTLWGSFGADLDSDPNLPVTDDIDAGARDATQPDIGADEFGATPCSPTIIYRSIGTSTANLADTGTASAGLGATIVTFSGVSLPTNIGQGDELTLDIGGANEILYILSRDSATQVTLQTATANDHSGGVSYTIKRAFSGVDPIQDWETARQGDLVALNRREVGVAYNDGVFVNGVDISGSVTDSCHFMRLTVAEGQRHTGVAGTGVRIDMSGEPDPLVGELETFDDYVVIEWFEVTGVTGNATFSGVRMGNFSANILLSNLILHGNENGARASGASPHSFTIRNSIIYDNNGVGIEGDEVGDTFFIDNCTIYNNLFAGVDAVFSTMTVRNTISMNNPPGSDFKASAGTLNQSNNISSDGTASGAGSLINRTATANGSPGAGDWVIFDNLTAGSKSFHLQNSVENDAIDAGTNLSFSFADDVDGEIRPAIWDVGADELFAGAASLTLADHDASQVGDRFTTTSPVTDGLFRFKLTRSGTVTIDTVKVNFTTGSGVVNGDVSAGELWIDTDNDGVIDGGDTLIQGSVTPSGGVLTFTNNVSPGTGGTNYLVRATVANLAAGDSTTFSVGTADIDEVEGGVTESGAITNAVHTQEVGAVIYYSVGTDSTALYSDTALASAGVLTLNSAAANNIGVGDEIREGANRYYITGRNSTTEFTIQDSAANGGTPGDANINFALTGITIFRAFNTLTLAEANSPDGNHLNTSDLVGSNFQLNWTCYDDTAMNDAEIVIDGWTSTGVSNYIRIYTPTDSSEVGTTQRHNGVAGSGFRLVPSNASPPSAYVVIYMFEDYVRIEGIEIDGSNISNGQDLMAVRTSSSVSPAGDYRFDYLLIHDFANSSVNQATQDGDMFIIAVREGSAKISNSILYNFEQFNNNVTSSIAAIRFEGAGTSYVHNVTIYNIKDTVGTGSCRGVDNFGGPTLTARNVAVFDVISSLDDEQCFNGVTTQSNNVSSDATAVGPQNQTAYATYFIDITDGSENLHLRNDSNTLWGSFGADLDGDPDLPVTDDIDGDARDASTPDIGADEFSSNPTTNYRSIGPVADYTTNDVTATNGSPIVIGNATAWVTANRGRGDRIQIDATDYTILSVDTNTQLTLTEPFTGATGPGKAYTISRQFDTLQEWEDCISAGVGCVYFPVTGGDLVADDRVEVGIAYDDGVFALTSTVTIDGSTTDATHTITLTADGVNRHYGVTGAGVVVDGQDFARELLILDNNVTVEWLEFIRVRGADNRAAIRVAGPVGEPSTNILLQNLLIHDFLDPGVNRVSGIRLSGDPGKSVTVRNCMIWDGDQIGIEADETTDTLIVENCSIDNMDSTVESNGTGIAAINTDVTVRNTIATSNPAGDFIATGSGGYSGASTNNTASDGTAPGASAQTAAAVDLFVAPNSNLHLISGAVAIDTAVDLSPSFSNDIDGDGRPFGLSWDRGADEFGQTYYRSIGPAPDYTTGTIDATNGSAVVTGTGTSWQTANRGRGDAITFPCPDPPTCTGGTDYTILSVDSETQLTLTAPVSGNFTGTYNVARQFDTLQEWEDCISAGVGCVYFPVTGGDLVGDNRVEVGIAYDDGAAFAELLIDDATTDANHTITLTVDPGNRHNGIAGQGVVVDLGPLGTIDAVRVRDDFVTVEWLEITGGQPTQGAEGIHVRAQSPSNQIILRNNIVHDVDGDGIVSAYEGVNIDIYNNIVYGGALNGIRINAVTPPHTGVIRILNNTVYNNALRGIRSSDAGSGKLLQNNIAHSNSPGLDFSITGTLDPASSNNLAGDASGIAHCPAGGGIDSVPLSGAGGVNFVSTVSGSEDLHITSASRAVGAAADLSGIFTDDIDGWIARQAPWDIGADEVDGAATSPTNYRSIGGAPHYTAPGTIDATGGSNVVTGTATTWLTANRGRGDVITFPCPDPPTCTGGTDYTVLSVDSNTQLTLTTPVSGNFTGTHKISRQFAALQDWETCISSGVGCVYFPVGGGDLVTDNRSEVGIAYDDGASFARVTIDGSITDANHTITLTVDPGNRHYGIAGQGVLLDNGTDTNDALRIEDDFVTVEWLEIQGGDIPSQPRGIFVANQNVPNKIIVRNNLIHEVGEDGIATLEADLVMDAYNNIIYATPDDGIQIGETLGPGAQIRLLNNTIYNCTDQGITSAVGDHSTVTLQNNIAFCTGNDFNITLPVNPASSNNLSGDGTATARSPAGGDRPNVALVDVQFVNTAGPIDLHIRSGSLLGAEDGGVDLSSVFNLDIDAGARTVLWEIGADDVEATTAVELVLFEAVGTDGAVELRWETGSELGNLGFHLYRSNTEEGPYDRITASVIPGLGSSPEGAKYAYRDSGLTNGVTYFYRLEDIETTGITELHGPVSAIPTAEVVVEGDTGGEDDSSGDELGDLTSRITYGDPSANELNVRRRGKKWMELELITEGFYAIPQDDGSVLLEVPGFEDFGGPDLPDVPAYRTWQDVLAGRRVKLASVKTSGMAEFASLRPSSSELIVVASGDGTVQTGRRRRKRRQPPHVYYPESWAQLMNVGFQGPAKKALVEMAPLRWDATAEKLVLARRIVVRIAFKGKDKAELKLGKSHREVGSHANRSVYARIAVTEPGLYGVSYESVFGNRRKAIKTSALRLSRQGVPVAFFVSPNAKKFKKKSVLYFLSDGAALNPYGHEAVYELESSSEGLQMGAVDGSPVGAPTSFYWKTLEREENLLYQAAFEGEEDIWQWDWLFGPMTNGYPFEVTNLSPVAENSKLRVWLHGASDFPEDPDHHVRLYVNGTLLTDTWWDGETPHFVEAELGPGLLQEGENTLEIEEVGDTEAQYSMVMLDRFEVSYPAQLLAEEGELKGLFSESGVATITGPRGQIGALSPPAVAQSTEGEPWGWGPKALIFDVTETEPRRISGASVVPGGLSFGVESGRHYLLTDSVKIPEVSRAQSTGLKQVWSRAEYLVIGPREFLAAAVPLLAHRRNEGLIAGAIATEDIFDEFGYGEATPESIRDFLSYVYHHWSEPTLRYVVLLGDGTYDTKDYLATGVTSQVPVKILKTRYIWTASDPWYGAINGDDILPDVAIGRLPAASVEEAERLVQKILEYESGEGDPEAPFVLVADNPDHGGDFVANAEELATTVLSGQEIDELYLSELGTAATRSEILDAFDSGASLMSYMGHGAIHLWGNENLLNIWDVDSLSPQSQQPFLLTMNCLNGYFHFPYFNSLSEELLKAEGKGIIAAFSPTGFSLNSPAHRFHKALLDHVVNQQHERLGDAILAGQSAYAQTGAFPELLRIYHLLGDPALRLR